MPDTFKTEFEKYIIFHRGVAAANIGSDGHLIITYQDGSTQDLGNVDGKQSVADAEDRIATINDTLNSIVGENGQIAQMQATLSTIAGTTGEWQQKLNALDTIKADIEEDAQTIQAGITNATSEVLSSVVGIETGMDDKGNTIYFVKPEDYATLVNVDDTIKSIQGVVPNKDQNGYKYLIEFDSSQMTAILNRLYEQLRDKGILEVDSNDNYYISRNDPILNDDIDAMFTEGKKVVNNG